MKKIITLVAIMLLTTGCTIFGETNDKMDVYTTVYPIKNLVEMLYGDHANINSIYPKDSDISEYELPEKLTKDYAKGDLFIYNGLTTEKNIAKDFVNENKNILLIDASHSLSIDSSVEELWLSPNNYLMLAKNIRDNLNEYIDNKYILEDINANYDALSESLSIMDADLRRAAKTAAENGINTLVITSDAFLFLENYGFEVISLGNKNNLTEENLKIIQNNFSNEKYFALINEYESGENEVADSLVDDYDAAEIHMKTLYTADDSFNYIDLMNEFIFNIELLLEK